MIGNYTEDEYLKSFVTLYGALGEEEVFALFEEEAKKHPDYDPGAISRDSLSNLFRARYEELEPPH